ncbi:hypothetical protein Adt_33613 [Abeliophyllum distichum]|uniref:Uncharacterized protein n=1 Tax=Abeliophyllum distichum TaxID=126358 RepID=A0ABD1QWQ6_9LAMI
MRTDLKEMMSMRSSRRHVLEDIEIKDEKIEEEAGRVSICIPPKNAFLLMRCRSDPMKMTALANALVGMQMLLLNKKMPMKVEKILIKRLRILKKNYTYKNVKL